MQNIETFDYEMNKEENVVSIQHSTQLPSDSFRMIPFMPSFCFRFYILYM